MLELVIGESQATSTANRYENRTYHKGTPKGNVDSVYDVVSEGLHIPVEYDAPIEVRMDRQQGCSGRQGHQEICGFQTIPAVLQW